MGMCKGCGEVFNTVELEDDYCKNCQDPKYREKLEDTNLNSQSTTKNVSFFKHVLNWKYYLINAVIVIFTIIIFDSLGMQNISEQIIKMIALVFAIYASVKYAGKGFAKLGIFFISYFLLTIFSLLIMIGLGAILNTIKEDDKKAKIINTMLNMNKKMPVMLNDQFQVIKYTSPNNNTITMHIRLVNYTKNKILAYYSNSISQFENEMLQSEQKESCPMQNVKEMLELGLSMNIEYLGKNNNIIGKIQLNDAICKPYYK